MDNVSLIQKLYEDLENNVVEYDEEIEDAIIEVLGGMRLVRDIKKEEMFPYFNGSRTDEKIIIYEKNCEIKISKAYYVQTEHDGVEGLGYWKDTILGGVHRDPDTARRSKKDLGEVIGWVEEKQIVDEQQSNE